VRAPVNLFLAPAHLASQLAAAMLERLGARRVSSALRRHGLLLETDMVREIAWRVHTELLELPCRQPGRIFRRDALLEEILADPELGEQLRAPLAAIGRQEGDANFRRRLERAMLSYAGTRPAAAEIAAGLLAAGIGALSVKQVTPGALTLGPLPESSHSRRRSHPFPSGRRWAAFGMAGSRRPPHPSWSAASPSA
jgi:hypothetical protein